MTALLSSRPPRHSGARRGLGPRGVASRSRSRDILVSHVTRCVVVYNTDVSWSLTNAQYWASKHPELTDVLYVGYPFGSYIPDSSNSQITPMITVAQREGFWEGLIRDIYNAVLAIDAHAVFCGPATPLYFQYEGVIARHPNQSPQLMQGILPNLLVNLVGIVRAHDRFGCAWPNAGWMVTGGVDSVNIHNWAWVDDGTLNGSEPLSVPLYNTWNERMTREKANPGVLFTSTSYAGQLGTTTELPRHRTPTFTENYYQVQYPYASHKVLAAIHSRPLVTGRIGLPVFKKSNSSARVWYGDETEAKNKALFDEAAANQGDFNTHRDKPVWIGFHNLSGSTLHSQEAVALYDILVRCGFRNLNYFTRNSYDTSYIPGQLARPPEDTFDYNTDLAGTSPDASPPGTPLNKDCFMLWGYGFRNSLPNDTTPDIAQEASGVSGSDITHAFRFLTGSLSLMQTSSSMWHGARCTERDSGRQPGGCVGWGCPQEPGASYSTASFLTNAVAVLQGFSAAEAQYMSSLYLGQSCFVWGDPLYAPFRYQEPFDLSLSSNERFPAEGRWR